MGKEDKDRPEPKVGVYICHCGGNISDHVDVEKVEELASRFPGVAVARRNSFMCSDPGQELIIKDIEEGRVNRVVVASCAPALHETTFRGAITRAGMNPYLYEHANIREQVSWVHHGGKATRKAAGLVEAAVAKAEMLEELTPIRVEARSHATVVGGGPAGMKAALDLSGRGIAVTLVEMTPFLGGNAIRHERLFPTGESSAELLGNLAARVLEDPGIEVLTCARVTSAKGYVGNFTLGLEQAPPQGEDLERLGAAGGSLHPGDLIPLTGVLGGDIPQAAVSREMDTGAIIMATGFRHYTPYQGHYGFAVSPRVITLPDFNRLLAGSKGKSLIWDGRKVESVAFVHCVGSREIPGLDEPPDGRPLNEYCSRVCCTATLQAQIELKEAFPETAVYDLHRDIRTYGRGHEEYYLNASRSGVLFLRFNAETPPRLEAGDHGVTLTVNDMLLGNEEIELTADLAVLAVGMKPGPAADLAEMLKLSTGADGFLLEVHPKLRPMEPAVNGVYLAGTCQAPMDVGEACSAAGAAAVKAGGLLARGYVELEPFVARVDPELCNGCGECLTACIKEDVISMADTPQGPRSEVNPALCLGCGVCTAVCEPGAMDLAGWTLPQYRAMVDALAAGAGKGEGA